MSSISDHIPPFTSELPALEYQKKCRGHDSAFSFDQGPVVQNIVSLTKSLVNGSLSLLVRLKSSVLIFFAEKMWGAFAPHIFSPKNASVFMYDMFEISTSRLLTSLVLNNWAQIFFSLADNKDRHKILDEFHFLTRVDYALQSYMPLSIIIFPHPLIMVTMWTQWTTLFFIIYHQTYRWTGQE